MNFVDFWARCFGLRVLEWDLSRFLSQFYPELFVDLCSCMAGRFAQFAKMFTFGANDVNISGRIQWPCSRLAALLPEVRWTPTTGL